ncbi:MAG: hypothetical protein HQ536_05285 [Parcubacteria group bacterium]|nr:hypothetical protein [Parcubacteria group bacterium]
MKFFDKKTKKQGEETMPENVIGMDKKGYLKRGYSYPMTFAEVRKEFPGLFVCGPSEINKLFGFKYNEDLPALGHIEISNFLKRIAEDFSGNRACAGLFLLTPSLKDEKPTNLQNLFAEFGGSFYRASWVLEEDFSEERADLSAVLVTLGSNPVFRGKDWEAQEALAKSRDEEILSITEFVYTILMLEEVDGVKGRIRYMNRTKTIHNTHNREDSDDTPTIGHRDNLICAGENNAEGMRITCQGRIALKNLGAASAVVRRIRG